ncbi:MAG: hypothetical protein PHF37_05765 [Phycisphaerae bacterium]|nr:hypothetical protein [Phycisphaerae bacterium]
MTGNKIQEAIGLVSEELSQGKPISGFTYKKLRFLLASVQEENVCPVCKGEKEIEGKEFHKQIISVPCPDCSDGTYRSWAENEIRKIGDAYEIMRQGAVEHTKQLAEKDKQIKTLEGCWQSDHDNCKALGKQISSLTAQRDEIIKELGVWSRKAGLLTTEVEKLKSEQKHIKNLCRVFDEFGELFDPECVLPDLADNVMYMVATKQQQLSAKDELIEKLKTALQSISEYWNQNENDRAMNDALYYMIETADAALAAAEQKEKK